MLLSLLLLLVVWVLLEYNESLEDGGESEVLLRSQLGPLPVGQQYGGRVCLEPCDGLGLPRLTHHVHSLQE